MARLGFLKNTPPRFQHSKQERHRLKEKKKKATYMHAHTHRGTYPENKNGSGIKRTYK